MSKLKTGAILEGFDTRFEVVSVISDELAVLKVLDCWDRYMNGGSEQGCYGSYLDIGKCYEVYKHKSLSDDKRELWIFNEDELKRTSSQLLFEIDENGVWFDMDS